MLNFKDLDGFKRNKLSEVEFSGRLAKIKNRIQGHRFITTVKSRKNLDDYVYNANQTATQMGNTLTPFI